jgi:cytochrome c-type biogenesis protein CcmH/NrfF
MHWDTPTTERCIAYINRLGENATAATDPEQQRQFRDLQSRTRTALTEAHQMATSNTEIGRNYTPRSREIVTNFLSNN